jgi:hypothetical protein
MTDTAAGVDTYDLAISFLAADEPLAKEIADELAPLRAFVYSKAQEVVAGREGVEAFREVFRSRSKVSLVLFRTGWGTTPWTRVEETAIRDRCLAEGWETLVFVVLDNPHGKPKWVPDSYVFLDLQAYSLEELVGVVKAACARAGSNVRRATAAERAESIAQRAMFSEGTKKLLDASNRPFYQEAETLFGRLDAICNDVKSRTGWQIFFGGTPDWYYVIRAQGFTLQLLTRELYANTARGTHLIPRLFEGGIVTTAERDRGEHFIDQPVEVQRLAPIYIDRAPGPGWGWRQEDKFFTSERMAEMLFDKLMNLVSARQD